MTFFTVCEAESRGGVRKRGRERALLRSCRAAAEKASHVLRGAAVQGDSQVLYTGGQVAWSRLGEGNKHQAAARKGSTVLYVIQ